MQGDARISHVRILGSGTSTGVPVIGCQCAVCRSNHPRNKRTRASIMLTTDQGEQLVIDTSPEFRSQALLAGLDRLEHVLYTHNHADHTAGFDDLRAFYFSTKKPVTCHVPQEAAKEFTSRFAYAFETTGYLGTAPQVILSEVGRAPFRLLGLTIEPIRVPHGNIQSVGYRFGNFAYVTDFKTIPASICDRWRGELDVMVASGIRRGTHPTHSCIEETLELFDRLEVRKGVITHMAHEVDYGLESKKMPTNVDLAFDGMEIVVPKVS